MSDLSAKLASANSNENDSDDSEDSSQSDAPNFAPNETTEGYYLFADAKSLDDSVNRNTGIERPDVNTYRLTREDIPRIREQAENEGWHPNAAKWAIDSAMKSWLGDRQRELNEGFGVGLVKDDDGTVVDWQDGQYAASFGATLPAVEHEPLDAGEVAALEDRGIDVDSLGFRPDGLPVLPVFTTGRAPVFVESYDELDDYIEMISEFPDEPSLGNIEASDGSLDPADFTVAELEEEIAEGYDADELRAALDAESDGKDRVTAIEALEVALEASDDSEPDPDHSPSDGTDASAEDKIQAFNALVESGVPADEAAERVGI